MGCRVNQVETERLRQSGAAHGFLPVATDAAPDLIIINTCSVTSESDRQARQLIRRMVRRHPAAQLIITGCYAQGHAHTIGEMPGVVLVLGNAEKERLWDHLIRLPRLSSIDGPLLSPPPAAEICVTPVTHATPHDRLALVDRFSDRSRAFLQVQDGCDARCTFCTIPSLRGPSRSLPLSHVAAQAQRYLQVGYQELVLTGINLGAYGRDLPSTHPQTLAALVQALSPLMHTGRVRLSSLDPIDLDAPLIEQFAINPRLCPYLHLSIQSGDDMVLKRMGRGYDRAFVMERVRAVRAVRPDMTFGADLIAGFPTETPAAWQNTHDLVHEAELALLHVFRYSDRPGTPAASMPARFRVAAREIHRRSERLRQAGIHVLAQTAPRWIGKRVEVLLETLKDGTSSGKTAGFLPVRCPAPPRVQAGQMIMVQVADYDPVDQVLTGDAV